MGGGDNTSVTRTEPPSYVKPYLTGDPKKGIPGLLPEAQRLYDSSNPIYFPGSTVASFAPETEAALAGTAARAEAGSPLTGAAGSYISDVLGGKYLDAGNPHLSELTNSLLGNVRNSVESRFGAAGRTGSGLEANAFMRGGTEALAPYLFGNYESERGRMDQAAQFAPTLAAQDYIDLNALLGVGDRRQQQGQAELTDEVNRHNFEQNVEQMKLNNLASILAGVPGATSYSTTPSNTEAGIMEGLFGIGSAALGIPGLFGS